MIVSLLYCDPVQSSQNVRKQVNSPRSPSPRGREKTFPINAREMILNNLLPYVIFNPEIRCRRLTYFFSFIVNKIGVYNYYKSVLMYIVLYCLDPLFCQYVFISGRMLLIYKYHIFQLSFSLCVCMYVGIYMFIHIYVYMYV